MKLLALCVLLASPLMALAQAGSPVEEKARVESRCPSCTKVLIRYVDQNGNHDAVISINQQDLLWKEHLQGAATANAKVILVRFPENADFIIAWQEERGSPVAISTGSATATGSNGYATASGFGVAGLLQKVSVQSIVYSKNGDGIFRVSHTNAWKSKPDAACLKEALQFIESNSR